MRFRRFLGAVGALGGCGVSVWEEGSASEEGGGGWWWGGGRANIQ